MIARMRPSPSLRDSRAVRRWLAQRHVHPLLMVCFDARIDIGLFWQIVSAHRSAAFNASPFGTTSLTKPSSYPSRAET